MKNFKINTFFALFLLISTNILYSQSKFGIEAYYGMNNVYEPNQTNLKHIRIGGFYEIYEDFEIKLDFASEKFRISNDFLGDESGVDFIRSTIHLDYNLSALLDREYYYNKFNLHTHVGIGYTIAKSSYLTTGKDEIVNVILGINPRYRIFNGFYLSADASFVINPSQHYNWDGSLTYSGKPNPITGLYYTISGGILIKFNDR
ncbi:hypothetical protein GFJ94_07050 [Flavobacterium sp. LMO8]|uniref:hypothetical protein n=1 Tax=Flavobacterium sp. LMO8 TaxID=2654244 RepID=UPI001291A0C8|nr:hypothetical protein [Flavobacterium sp. LMO8]MQP24820.1 hypothetical protein [Flavobacterium sp. LMO8]